MGIKASEQQAQQEAVIEAYDFLVNNTHYRYTSYYQEQTIGGNLYAAIPIECDRDLILNSDLAIRECLVSIPADNAFAVIMRTVKDTRQVSLTLTKFFSDDLVESMAVFYGLLVSVGFEDGICTMKYCSIALILENNIPRVIVQSVCNNTLFDDVCALDSDSFKVPAIVTVSNAGKTLTSASFGAYGDGYFKEGKVYFPTTGEYRYITNHVGNDITLHYELSDLSSGDTVHAWPGCSKQPDVCDTKFINIDNFVGMPYVPLKDPEKTPITNE